jgi:hypothetical protein
VKISEAPQSSLRLLKRGIASAMARNPGHAQRSRVRSEAARVFIGGSMRVWQKRLEMTAEEGRQCDDSRAD